MPFARPFSTAGLESTEQTVESRNQMKCKETCLW